MTWTYSLYDLSTSSKDQVRMLVGDTVPTDQQMQDEEINFIITQRSTIYGAAAMCCRTLAAKFARSVDAAAGDTKYAFSQMSKAYATKAAIFEAQAATNGGAMPYAGGISMVDKLNQETDGDRVKPQFNIGMNDDYIPFPSGGNETEDQGSQ